MDIVDNMKTSQQQKILNLLSDNQFHCTSEMYAMYCADPRTRLCELKKKGYELECRKCKTHDYHDGGSKEWRLIGQPNHVPEVAKYNFANYKVIKPEMVMDSLI